MNKTIINTLKRSFLCAVSISTGILTFLPESLWKILVVFPKYSCDVNILFNRLCLFIILFVFSLLGNSIYIFTRQKVMIKGHNYCIQVEYGDLFNISNGKILIPFDECFTTVVGSAPEEINPNSICGQYLSQYPISNIQELINTANLKPLKIKSSFHKKDRYESGKIIPNGQYLLLAFAKLNHDGLGCLSRNEYLDSLSTLWKELDKHYGQMDVHIPILGSGVTRIDNNSLTQQESLDIIIESYKLSSHKIKNPYKLHIVCKKQTDFTINKIGESL